MWRAKNLIFIKIKRTGSQIKRHKTKKIDSKPVKSLHFCPVEPQITIKNHKKKQITEHFKAPLILLKL